MNFLAWIERHAGIILACALLLAGLLLLVGCGRRQAQDLADAKAGAMAYQQEPDQERRAQIATGVTGHILAGLDQYPMLPPPTLTPTQIRSDPLAYAVAGEQAQADPQPYRPEDHPAPVPPTPGPIDRLAAYGDLLLRWGMIVGGIAGALVLGLALAKTLGIGAGTWLLRLLLSPVIAPVLRLAALWGTGAAVVGAALTWLAAWWWAVLLVAVVVGVVVAWVHWHDIRAWWRRRKAGRA